RVLELLHDRGALVPRMGVRRRAVGGAGALRAVLAARVPRELAHPRARDPLRERLPARRGRGDLRLHGTAAARHPEPLPLVPRREPLGPQAEELDLLAPERDRVAGSLAAVTVAPAPAAGAPRERRRRCARKPAP